MHGNKKILNWLVPFGQASLFFYLCLLIKGERDKINKGGYSLGISKLCKI